MRITLTALLSLALLTSACSDGGQVGDADTVTPPSDTAQPVDTEQPPPDTAGPADVTDPEVQGPPPIVGTYSTSIGGWTMSPGQETTRCAIMRLDNPEEMWVTQVRTDLSQGSHHLIVYVSEEEEERPEPFSCPPFVDTLKGETFPLMITQIRKETLTFPEGVAFRFKPNQMVRLEAHYLNYFPQDITTEAHVHFDIIAPEDVRDQANILFYGNPDINIPPGAIHSTPWRFLSVPNGIEVFAITGHTHQYGTNVEIHRSDSSAEMGEEIYPAGETFLWDEPPVNYFDPPLVFGERGGFHYRCTWNNTTDQTLRFGESFNQEMCFFWAYYYPSDGYRLCVNPGALGGGAFDEICCPGSPICEYIRGFL